MFKLKKTVENIIGKVTSEEWAIATRDVAGNNIMASKTYHDEILIEKLITSMD